LCSQRAKRGEAVISRFILSDEKIEMECVFLVESVNTGRQWRFDAEIDLKRFLIGRNLLFYRIFTRYA
ncbi:MAG: hypothetical protein KDE33_29835, partial [Bacteroidetes bacterium]|nr:hypothetical protein [Bacteroidota bacterium]